MKLVIETQYMENYGAHDWNGVGECPQYWKMKGGYTYVIENVENYIKGGEFFDRRCEMIVDGLRLKLETSTEYMREYIIGWNVRPDDWMSEFEKDQLEYAGVIDAPDHRIDLEGRRVYNFDSKGRVVR